MKDTKKHPLAYAVIALTLFFPFALQAQQQAPQAEPQSNPKKNPIEIKGSVRVRPELKVNLGFTDGLSNTYDYTAQKTSLTIIANPVENTRAVVTLQDARIWGGTTGSPTGLSSSNEAQAFDLREGFIEYTLPLSSPLTFTLGRQKIALGDQRLFGSLEWTNIGRSFDALKLRLEIPDTIKLHIWSAVLNETNSKDIGQVSAFDGLYSDTYYVGLYNEFFVGRNLQLDTYYSGKLNTADSTTLKLHTAGLRITNRTNKGKTQSGVALDYSLEGAYQFGKKADLDVSAWATAIRVGYTLEGGIKLRIGAEADAASGDRDNVDKVNQTFDNLFPTNHAHYGQADMISWQNLLAFSGNITAQFSEKISLVAAYWYLSKLSDKDNWYTVAGGTNTNTTWVSNPATGQISAAKQLAHEIDLTGKLRLNNHFSCELGYSIVLRGDALIEAKKNRDFHFVYLAGTMQF